MGNYSIHQVTLKKFQSRNASGTPMFSDSTIFGFLSRGITKVISLDGENRNSPASFRIDDTPTNRLITTNDRLLLPGETEPRKIMVVEVLEDFTQGCINLRLV